MGFLLQEIRWNVASGHGNSASDLDRGLSLPVRVQDAHPPPQDALSRIRPTLNKQQISVGYRAGRTNRRNGCIPIRFLELM